MLKQIIYLKSADIKKGIVLFSVRVQSKFQFLIMRQYKKFFQRYL